MFFVRARSTKKLAIVNKRLVASGDPGIPLDLDNYFYIRNWAVSSYENWGLNQNADGWRAKNLKDDYKSFDGAWVCLNHVADNHTDSIGIVLHPVYTPENYVENILAVNRKKAIKKGQPYLEKDILDGRVTDTSMGCLARASECSICGNVAQTDDEYCEHLRFDDNDFSLKGTQVIVGGKSRIVGELYIDSVFIEDSILTNQEGADINAKIFNIAANKRGAKVASGDALYYAIKATIKENGMTPRMGRLLEIFDKLK